MGRTNQTQDRLDALLDGRPGEVTDDLAPLLAAAEALRAELADFELDPEVVDRHLEQALDRPATVVELPVRKAGGGVLRRRLAAAGLAAALLLVPATAASAASAEALPGQALYPVKLAVEQFRLAAVQWSPTREAQERAKIAAKRLEELNRLGELRMFRQIPSAIRALDKAFQAAEAAVVEAAAEEGADPELAAVVNELARVAVAQHEELVALKEMANVPSAVTQAVDRSPAALQPNLPTVPSVLQPVVTTVTTSPTEPPVTTVPPTPGPRPEPTTAPPNTTAPPTTIPPTTTAPTTTAPTTTTTTPPSTEGPAGTAGAQGSPAGAGGAEASTTSSTLPQ